MVGTDRVEIRTLKVGRFCVVDDEAYKILSISTSKPGKHGSAKARISLESIFTGKKISHVGSVTDSINVPMIEKGTATVTHMDGNEVHAMNDRDYSMMILPMPSSAVGMTIEAGQKIMWQEALGRYIIIRDH
ncbi:MAG: translation initiation factor IF-5A [Candidatus Poseidoniaceae archaeon]|jgi:translation initiation factor 5A|nr:translation initiation factor IF-5A [Candidatus Poseidoniaceae archaeon]|tara:strand:+ start:3265 stop:3660 length:396 start_codon:yes stop_codon:yes gene_type:complete